MLIRQILIVGFRLINDHLQIMLEILPTQAVRSDCFRAKPVLLMPLRLRISQTKWELKFLRPQTLFGYFRQER